jgi:hypothetical protein
MTTYKTVGLYIYSTYLPKNRAESWQLGFLDYLVLTKNLAFLYTLTPYEGKSFLNDQHSLLFLLDEAIKQYSFR